MSTPDILTLSQAAAMVGRSDWTFRAWRSNGIGPPAYWHGRSLIYLRHEVEEWAEKHKQQLNNRELPR